MWLNLFKVSIYSFAIAIWAGIAFIMTMMLLGWLTNYELERRKRKQEAIRQAAVEKQLAEYKEELKEREAKRKEVILQENKCTGSCSACASRTTCPYVCKICHTHLSLSPYTPCVKCSLGEQENRTDQCLDS